MLSQHIVARQQATRDLRDGLLTELSQRVVDLRASQLDSRSGRFGRIGRFLAAKAQVAPLIRRGARCSQHRGAASGLRIRTRRRGRCRFGRLHRGRVHGSLVHRDRVHGREAIGLPFTGRNHFPIAGERVQLRHDHSVRNRRTDNLSVLLALRRSEPRVRRLCQRRRLCPRGCSQRPAAPARPLVALFWTPLGK